jgi:site-specific recombinase XerD
MLERYFIRPTTVDRIRASWIGEPIERYVTWLTEQGYAPRNVFIRVPILMRFGEFARSRGATTWEGLGNYVEPFVKAWLIERGKHRTTDEAMKAAARAVRGPIHQALRLIIPGYSGGGRSQNFPNPFMLSASGFFTYLRSERGLRETTIIQYSHHLRCFESYLRSIDLYSPSELSPAVLSAFIILRSHVLGKKSMQWVCTVLKIFLRYLYREGLIGRDLTAYIDSPRQYGHAQIPRSISWDEVRCMLEAVDRRSRTGKRDYAILLLLVTYGLRAREIAALTLDNIDWKSERLRVPERKSGHSTAFPLLPIIGEAILDYLQHSRPETSERALFFRAVAPYTPMTYVAVSLRVKHYLRKAGIDIPRPGSHTLRHTCVQRLIDAQLSFKTIGDYVGHSSPDATKVYAKVSIEALREVAMGDGEAVV